MQVELRAQHEPNDETAQAHTGRTLTEWFQAIDAQGGTAQGRRAIGEFLLREHKVDAWWTSTITVEYEKARGLLEKDGRPKGYSICVTKNVAAPAARVWRAFTTPAELSTWLGAGMTSEAKEGETFANADGNRGTYLRLSPPKTLRFTWHGGACTQSSVEVKLQDKDGKCGITLNHERIATRAEADGLRTGWGRALQRLKEQLEG